MNDFNLNAKRQMFHFAKKKLFNYFKTFLLFNFIRFRGDFFKELLPKRNQKNNCLISPKNIKKMTILKHSKRM